MNTEELAIAFLLNERKSSTFKIELTREDISYLRAVSTHAFLNIFKRTVYGSGWA